ncbi:MAG: N-acetylmuramoyl-L-alanine amidase [Dehalococcoidia bacterium]|nr:MAG: N-acetylmuramoyl-L-alanine amidase [Dehalococcoidia bacterium]
MGALTDILINEEGVNLRDLRAVLPVNPKQAWLFRTLDVVKGAIVHHTVGKPWYTSKAIARMHIRIADPDYWPHGWPGMAYTFYIHTEGPGADSPVVTDFCHRIMQWGPQSGATNAETFGVALGGNFVREAPDPRMVRELVKLLTGLQTFYVREVHGQSLYIKPHFQVSSTKCPGLAWGAYLAAIGHG